MREDLAQEVAGSFVLRIAWSALVSVPFVLLGASPMLREASFVLVGA